jgi:hypothetical protein
MMLQILKFIYKQDRLNFTEDLVAYEQDYIKSGPVTPRAVDELVAAGKFHELDELLQNSRDSELDVISVLQICSYTILVVTSLYFRSFNNHRRIFLASH